MEVLAHHLHDEEEEAEAAENGENRADHRGMAATMDGLPRPGQDQA
ncbi:MAG: hypothetical protein ACO4A5_09905 [Candidatus Puniceispirillaceae bacterium]